MVAPGRHLVVVAPAVARALFVAAATARSAVSAKRRRRARRAGGGQGQMYVCLHRLEGGRERGGGDGGREVEPP